jgi:catechol 2,3-dioxygenase-like lactoylglutathione lyase family enzyme
MSSVFLVDRIEPCLDFWVDRLGFDVRLQVHGDDHLEFATLGRDDLEFVYRTLDSLHEDTPGLVDGDHQPWVVIYLEVDDFDEILPRLEGLDIVVPARETILGTREIFVREPSGRILALTSRD